jgi:hypothetical protein
MDEDIGNHWGWSFLGFLIGVGAIWYYAWILDGLCAMYFPIPLGMRTALGIVFAYVLLTIKIPAQKSRPLERCARACGFWIVASGIYVLAWLFAKVQW